MHELLHKAVAKAAGEDIQSQANLIPGHPLTTNLNKKNRLHIHQGSGEKPKPR